MKHLLIAFGTIICSCGAFSQNVGIGTNIPNTSAKLDVTSTNSGLLIPRISLISTTDVATIPAPVTSLLVYNTNAGITGGSGTGYYYWTGALWTKLLSGTIPTAGWNLVGNGGTNPATNFIGTTDGTDFVTRTNNIERMRVNTAGNVGIGTIAPAGRLHLLNVDNSSMVFGGTGNISVNDPETFVGEVRLGAAWNRPGVYSSSQLELQNNGAGIFFGTGNTEHMRLTNGGNLGIGTNAPAQRLSVNGTIQAIDVYGAGGQNIQIGDDSYLSDMDIQHRLGIISSSNAGIGEVILGNSGTNPVLTGVAGSLTISQEVRIQNATNRVRRSTTPQTFTDQFDGFPSGVHLSNNESEEGGFWANGNYAMVYSPGDNDLVKFVDEDGFDNAGTTYDNVALRARIDGGGQYFQVSDANAKHNIVKMNNGLSKVISLNGYTYDFNLLPGEIEKNSPIIHGVGVLAQEVENILPEAVSNVDGHYMVNYNAFVPLFIEAFKDQQVIIDEQNQKIDAYEKELESTRLKQDELAKEMEQLKRMLLEKK